MRLSHLARLSPDNWLYSTDQLFKSYRAYTSNGAVCSKAGLALSATINAVKTIAYVIFSPAYFVLGFTRALIRVICMPGQPDKLSQWEDICFHAEMTKVSFCALFRFKPVMKQLGRIEAEAFYTAAITGAGWKKVLNTQEIEDNLFVRLKRLETEQFKDIITIQAPCPCFYKKSSPQKQYPTDLLGLLGRLRQDVNEEKQKVIDARIIGIHLEMMHHHHQNPVTPVKLG